MIIQYPRGRVVGLMARLKDGNDYERICDEITFYDHFSTSIEAYIEYTRLQASCVTPA